MTHALRPTMYFIGVTTGQSSIMKVFPRWAEALGLDAVLVGIDVQIHAPPAEYRRVVEFIGSDPLSLGALVTTHKIDLLTAARDMFDELDPYAQILGEVSSISKQNGRLWGHAKDPITSGLALEAFLPEGWWRQRGVRGERSGVRGERRGTRGKRREKCESHPLAPGPSPLTPHPSPAALIFGAGGSSLAVSMYLMDPAHGDNRPGKVVVTNRSTPRLEEMRRIHNALDYGVPCEYHHCPTLEENDRVLACVPPGSLVINATGLGKDRPGSPITDLALFPENGLAWDFNYRGDLQFLVQARAQAEQRNLVVEDGWIYFIRGWTQVIAEVFHIPIGPDKIGELSRIAAEVRQAARVE